HLVLDAEDASTVGDLCLAALGERTAGHLEVSDVAVGHRDELYFVTARGPQRGDARRFQLRIVWMRAKGDDPQRPRSRRLQHEESERRGDQADHGWTSR